MMEPPPPRTPGPSLLPLPAGGAGHSGPVTCSVAVLLDDWLCVALPLPQLAVTVWMACKRARARTHTHTHTHEDTCEGGWWVLAGAPLSCVLCREPGRHHAAAQRLPLRFPRGPLPAVSPAVGRRARRPWV
jgi:hypothetical protein